MNPIEEKPFTNDFGDVINPGDKIYAITTGRGNTVNIYKGHFVGFREFKPFWTKNEPEQRVVCDVEDKQFGYFHPETGASMKFSDAYALGIKGEFRPVIRRCNMQLNRIFPRN